MNILLIGGTGNAGARIAREALDRHHHVTIASRHGGTVDVPGHGLITAVRLDAADADAVAAASEDHDVIIAATRPAAGHESAIVDMTSGLATGAATTGRRLLVVGGAAPLQVPGTDRIALDDPQWVPPRIRPFAAASNRQLDILRDHTTLNWTYAAPAATFQPGRRTGHYSTTDGELVITADGTSEISMEDYAIALIDLAEDHTTRPPVVAIGPRSMRPSPPRSSTGTSSAGRAGDQPGQSWPPRATT